MSQKPFNQSVSIYFIPGRQLTFQQFHFIFLSAAIMGLHVDVSHLTQEECYQIVCVIARDISLRKFDQERIRSGYSSLYYPLTRRELL